MMTVVVPTYNRREYLQLALKSALDQTVGDYEVLVVDDGSTDDSAALVERMQKTDSRLRLVVHGKNEGVSSALNTGIENCRSEYVTFLGSDDLFARERIEHLSARLDDAEGDAVVYSDTKYIDAGQAVVGSEPSKASERPQGMIFPDLLTGSFRFSGGILALPKRCFDEVGLYDERLSWAEDFDMALRLAERFPFVFDPLSTYGYRIYGGNKIRTLDKKDRWSQQGRILESHLIQDYGRLDEETRRTSFRYLFSCFVASGQWGEILRYGFTKEAGFCAMVGLPLRLSKKAPR